ncbi:flagellar biosynthetic protein FliR [Algimonas porphyrae]|uniref:Flagellar biosynthesis protein FliR n=1 Tax=Algimonas porphyrae TaxID=1128113 RepID=A0ABQ5V3X3_9PROT|nr:flagellar biosynthetic protein FliR [Algimonas porphyrae]GLQ21419.1 flagellar biosynthesis protein FliR [Algimonas porphyrae]
MAGAGQLLSALAEAFGPLVTLIWPIFGLFARLSLFFMLVPVFGERAVPARLRIGIAALCTFLLFPVLQDSLLALRDSSAFELIITEALTGFVLGFALRLAVHALQILGMIVSQSLSLSQVLGEGIATEPNTTISTMLMLAGVTLLVSMNLHIELIGVLAGSFTDMPVGTVLDMQVSANWLTQITVGLLRLCLSLALPFVILNFAYNLILGFLNRAMPQLLVSFVGLPGMTLAGLFLLVICASAMMMAWVEAVGALMVEAS